MVARCGLASCCQWWSVNEPVKNDVWQISKGVFYLFFYKISPPLNAGTTTSASLQQYCSAVQLTDLPWAWRFEVFQARRSWKHWNRRRFLTSWRKRKSRCPSGSCNHYRPRLTAPAASSRALLGRTGARKGNSAVAATAGGGLGWGRFLQASQVDPLATPLFKRYQFINWKTKCEIRIYEKSLTYPCTDSKGCAVITRELSPEPGIGGVAVADREAEALMERTVWKTLLWDDL